MYYSYVKSTGLGYLVGAVACIRIAALLCAKILGSTLTVSWLDTGASGSPRAAAWDALRARVLA